MGKEEMIFGLNSNLDDRRVNKILLEIVEKSFPKFYTIYRNNIHHDIVIKEISKEFYNFLINLEERFPNSINNLNQILNWFDPIERLLGVELPVGTEHYSELDNPFQKMAKLFIEKLKNILTRYFSSDITPAPASIHQEP